MKRWLSLFMALALVAAIFAGCAQAPVETTPDTASVTTKTATTPATDKQPEPVEITFWFYPNWEQAEEVLGEQLGAKIHELYPNITVNYEMLSWDAGPEKFTVAMATGATPDVYQDGYSRIAPAVNAGLTADVTDVAEAIKPYIYDGIEHAGMVDGRNMAITFHISGGYEIGVNVTLAKKLGVYDMLPEDRTHWSYDDFLKICRAAKTADSSIYAMPLWAGSRSSDAWYYSWLMAGGTGITNADCTEMVVETPEAAATLGVFKTLIDEGMCPAGSATMKDQDVEAFFISQQALFTHSGFNMMNMWQNMMDSGELDPFEYDLVAIPTPDGKADPVIATWGPSNFAVFKNGNDEAKIDAAKKLVIAFFEQSEFAKAYGEGYGEATLVKAAQPEYTSERIKELAEWHTDYTNKCANSDFGILMPWWSDFRETFYVELQGYYTGNLTVEQALANWTANGTAVIKAAAQG